MRVAGRSLGAKEEELRLDTLVITKTSKNCTNIKMSSIGPKMKYGSLKRLAITYIEANQSLALNLSVSVSQSQCLVI